MKVAGFWPLCVKERKPKHFRWALVFGSVYYLGIMYLLVQVSVGFKFQKLKTDLVTRGRIGCRVSSSYSVLP